MAVKYEWRETRSGRRFVRTVVPDTTAAEAKVVVQEPEVETETLAAELVVAVEESPKPKRGRPKKVVTPDE